MNISIIIAYNKNRGYLSKAIKSAETQIFNGDYEIVISQSKANRSINVNNGLKKSKGEFIKILDEDDQLLPYCLQVLYDKIIEGFDLVCANIHNIGLGKNNNYKSTIPETITDLALCNTIHNNSVLYRKNKLPLFNENLWTGEEYEIYLKMAENKCKFGYIDEFVGIYQMHENQKSLVNYGMELDKIKERKKYIFDNIQRHFINSSKKINK